MNKNGLRLVSPPEVPDATTGRGVSTVFSKTALSLEKKMMAGFGIAFLCFVTITVALYRGVINQIDANSKAEEANLVLSRLESVWILMEELQTGSRGYILTGREEFLDPYHAALAGIDSAMEELRVSVANNHDLGRTFETLAPLVMAKKAFANETVTLRKEKGFEAAQSLFSTGRGKEIMDQIRAVIRDAKNSGEDIVNRRAVIEKTGFKTLTFVITLSSLLLLLLIAWNYYIVRNDLAHRRENEARVQASEERFRSSEENLRLAVTGAGIGTWQWDIARDGLVWSDRCRAIFGLLPGEPISYERFLQIVHPDDRERVHQAVSDSLSNRTEYNIEYRIVRPDGGLPWILAKGSGYYDDLNKPIRMQGVVMDITDRKSQDQVLEHQAWHDTLTALPNRTLLKDRLTQAFSAASREKTNLSLLFMDLDRFKEVNDSMGHHFGDLLLKQVGERLAKTARESDTIARLGGDEFAMLLPHTNAEGAVIMAKKIILAMMTPFTIETIQVNIGISIGIAQYPDDTSDPEAMMRHADTAMYAAKRNRSGYVVYTPANV